MSGITVACIEFHDASDCRPVTGSRVSAKDRVTGEIGADETAAICQVVCLLVSGVKEVKCGAEDRASLACLIASHAFCDTRPTESASGYVYLRLRSVLKMMCGKMYQ